MIEEKKQEDIVATVKLVNKNYKQNKKKRCSCKIRNKSATQNMIQ